MCFRREASTENLRSFLILMTLALGIDPGTATTGYGLVRLEPDGGLVAVKYGVILTPKDATASARLGDAVR